jgi:hypothetical protein
MVDGHTHTRDSERSETDSRQTAEIEIESERNKREERRGDVLINPLEGDHENFAQQNKTFVSIFELKKPMTLKEC